MAILLEEYNLLKINPKLSREWHPKKNGKLSPKDFKPNSNKKVWWICKKKHEWEATIVSRNKGLGCPYCSNFKVCKDNCLAMVNKALSKEWHPIKNNELTPRDVTPGSDKKVWWICKKGHEWQARVYNRTKRKPTGCPFCSNRKVCKDNCLATVNKAIVKEWHPTKNKGLTPKDVTPQNGKKVWWICKKGHEWQAIVYNRIKDKATGCPFCSNRKAYKDNCLAKVKKTLAKEWHPKKNNGLTPKDVTLGSSKKVWWICKKGHEWQAKITHRTNGSGCPYCCNKKACKDNCLATLNRNLALEWHPTKNNNLTPKDIVANSEKKVWWICRLGHEWEASVYQRNSHYILNRKGTGCPYCYYISKRTKNSGRA